MLTTWSQSPVHKKLHAQTQKNWSTIWSTNLVCPKITIHIARHNPGMALDRGQAMPPTSRQFDLTACLMPTLTRFTGRQYPHQYISLHKNKLSKHSLMTSIYFIGQSPMIDEASNGSGRHQTLAEHSMIHRKRIKHHEMLLVWFQYSLQHSWQPPHLPMPPNRPPTLTHQLWWYPRDFNKYQTPWGHMPLRCAH